MKRLFFLPIIFCLLLTDAKAQTGSYNFDFEDWHMDMSEDRLDYWKHIYRNGDTIPSLHGTEKSTLSYTGNYAITIHRWYVIVYDGILLHAPISNKPVSLNGFYKYTDVKVYTHPDTVFNDTAKVALFFTKWNGANNQADTIGSGYLELSQSMSYTPFSCNIAYTGTDQPDSFYIIIQPTKHWSRVMCLDSPDCSFLTIDNLSFSNTTSINNITDKEAVTVYPNPTKDEIHINSGTTVLVQKISLIDIAGRTLITQEGNVQKINLKNLPCGTYFLKLYTNEGVLVKKLVIER